MYLMILPVWDTFNRMFELNYKKRLDMMKTSILLKSCKKNTILTYLLLFVEIIAFSLFVNFSYKASIKMLSLIFLFYYNIFLLIAYVAMNFYFYSFFDKEDYRNRVNGNLDEAASERLEMVVTNEEEEYYPDISVRTNHLSSGNN